MAEDGAGLSLQDLVGTLRDSTQYNDLKKRMEQLSKGPAPLSTPASSTVRNRAQRRAQYEESTKEVSKWEPLVKAGRRQKHTSFSAEANLNTRPDQTVGQLAEKFTPRTALEKAVAAAVGTPASGGAGAGYAPHNDMPELDDEAAVADMQQRLEAQRELAKLRPQLFYAEQKKRRMNKIKSKSYRKIRKKQRTRLAVAERERLRQENPTEAARLDEEDAMKRARERMTLKHRNKGKWAKRMLKIGGTSNEAVRDALNEHVTRAEELKRKMDHVSTSGDGDGSSGSSSDDSFADSGDSDEDSDDAAARARRKARRDAARLADEIERAGVEGDDEDAPTTGLFSLKFMKNAARRQREKAKAEALALVKELGEDTGSEASDGDDDGGGFGDVGGGWEDAVPVSSAPDVGAGSGSDAEPNDDGDDSDASDGGQRKASHRVPVVAVPVQQVKPLEHVPPTIATDAAPATGSGRRGRRGGRGAKAATSDAPAPAAAAQDTDKGKGKGQGKGKAQSAGNASVPDTGATKRGVTFAESTVVPPVAAAAPPVADSDAHGDLLVLPAGADAAVNHRARPKKPSAREVQAELVRRAFAGYGALETDIQREKEELAGVDVPEPDAKTPKGWGSWAGMGAPEPAKPTGPTPEQLRAEAVQKALAARKDAKKKRVIINERRDKKLTKHQAATVPYPFKSREEYERSLRAPVGREWNTSEATARQTLPEVVTQAGLIINPIRLTKVPLTKPPGQGKRRSK